MVTKQTQTTLKNFPKGLPLVLTAYDLFVEGERKHRQTLEDIKFLEQFGE
jgi:hypothetical protein